MDQTGERSSANDGEEDDLLKTIRQMVSDEVAREPSAPTSAEPEPVENETDAATDGPSSPGAQPLVLGAMARVAPKADAANTSTEGLLRLETPTAPGDLRSVVQDVVREELDLLLGDTLATRVQQLVRREVAELLMKARGGE